MDDQVIYKDRLLEIVGSKIIFKGYYFPSMKPKEVLVENIEKVEVKKPTIATGKYRYQGTGDFRTWYPMDAKRNERDKIFFLFLKTQRIRIGFTSENSEPVEKYFRDKGLLS